MKVDTKVIYPFESQQLLQRDETLQALLVTHEVELPRPSTWLTQNKKVGIIILSGSIKDLSFENTNLDTRASKCDALVLMFDRNLSYPQDDYNDTKSILLVDNYSNIMDYFTLPSMIKLLIMGIEQTLLRRVVAVGQEVISMRDYNHWIEIPKNRIQVVEKENY